MLFSGQAFRKTNTSEKIEKPSTKRQHTLTIRHSKKTLHDQLFLTEKSVTPPTKVEDIITITFL